MKQVSYDKLLKINSQPGITCPIINGLLFDGRQRTRIVKFKIDDFDDKAYIDASELSVLIEAMDNLEMWARDLVEVYKNLNEETLEYIFENIGEEIDDIISRIINGIENSFDYKINHEVDQVNKYASELESVINDYIEKVNLLDSEEKELNDWGKLLSKIDEEENPKEYETLLEEIENKELEIEKLNKTISNIEKDFRYAEISFYNQTSDFSELLEEARERNDLLRTEAKYLKDILIKHAKEELCLYQPLEFLNKEYKDDNVINLGIIYKDEKEKNILFKYLKDNNIINEEQYKFHTEVEKLNIKETMNNLLKTLKDNGFKGVRYYEKSEDFFNRIEPQSLLIKKNKNKMELK